MKSLKHILSESILADDNELDKRDLFNYDFKYDDKGKKLLEEYKDVIANKLDELSKKNKKYKKYAYIIYKQTTGEIEDTFSINVYENDKKRNEHEPIIFITYYKDYKEPWDIYDISTPF